MAKPAKPFLFIDGEGGNNLDGSHEYVVLCAWSAFTDSMILQNSDGSALHSRQIFDWLLDLYTQLRLEGAPHTFVGFGLGYDIDMWLKDLPDHPLKCLKSPARMGRVDAKGSPMWVPWDAYCFRQLGSEFQVIESVYGRGAKVDKEHRKTLTVWDVWKFFQGSFVKALQDWKILDAAALNEMTAMKRKRSTFQADEITQEIIDYCISECKAGVALVTKLDETCRELGYPLTRYDGAGSLAAAMMKAWRINEYQTGVPEKIHTAVSCAYFGGRFEIAAHGRTQKPVYQYDINSAYPTIIRNLPCLKHAEWESSEEVAEFGIYEVEWAVEESCYWGPLPWRNKKGEITYPVAGHGWFWGSELLAAERLYPNCINVLKGYRLLRECEHTPFQHVSDVYLQRQQLGKNAAGIVLKLGLNSLYGKTAQSVGQPKYANYIWAGMITAGCRAMILDAIRLAGPEHILMTATDSVLSDCPIPELPCPPAKPLGAWDMACAPGGILIIQPGITIAYDDAGQGTYKSRGLGKAEFARHAIAAERQWESLGILGSFTAKSHRFIGIRTALARNKFETRCRWADAQSRLTYFPGIKRRLPDSELLAHTFSRQAHSIAAGPVTGPSHPYKQIYERLAFDEAQFIEEQPAIECELLEWESEE